MTNTLTATEVYTAFSEVGFDLNKLAAGRPDINEWFIAQGYQFEFGLASEALLIKDGIPKRVGYRRESPAELFKQELWVLMVDDPSEPIVNGETDAEWLERIEREACLAETDDIPF